MPTVQQRLVLKDNADFFEFLVDLCLTFINCPFILEICIKFTNVFCGRLVLRSLYMN